MPSSGGCCIVLNIFDSHFQKYRPDLQRFLLAEIRSGTNGERWLLRSDECRILAGSLQPSEGCHLCIPTASGLQVARVLKTNPQAAFVRFG
ncbi:MAG TPA: hypothetical protein DEF45_19985 [Rhodopirellula sp.]|nr:MAG: hypothetical protein CBD74_00440 [Saprospirales bacterium TMED214]HBV65295.1 hypothetical protein [Rhodopirellula sp.]